MTTQSEIEIFIININAINYVIKKYIDSNIKIAPKRKTSVDLFSKLSLEYHSYINFFSILESDKLLPHWNYNYKINLVSRSKPDYETLYKMSRDEFVIL